MERRHHTHHTRFVGLTLALLALAGFVGAAYAMDLESWDEKITKASKRFTVLSAFNNEAVLDKETQLVWEKSPGETDGVPGITAADRLAWASARVHCLNKNVGGRKGWRLPSFVELASLEDPANTNAALPTGHPFTNIQSNDYWSASTNAAGPTSAWRVSFDDGFVGFALKSNSHFVWCVRGEMNADQY